MRERPLRNYEEATQLKLLRPQLARKGKQYDQWIVAASPAWQRVAAVQLTRYLSLEARIKQDLAEDASCWIEKNTSVFSITDEIWLHDGSARYALVGIVTFHNSRENPVLYQCYLHPFYRRQGRMKKAWSEVQARYPQYEIEDPRSASMQQFLCKVDCSHILAST